MRMLTDGLVMSLDTLGDGVRVSVKDLIDMVGIPTTAGSFAVARMAVPAERDAACLTGVRAADARIVGRTAMHELAYGISGINAWQGTPTNPLDASRVPGGSSSGAAVSVATGVADVALGSDTGGSVRIPAACCGVAGLKTTWGRIPLDGVWPLAPSLDTIGPLARDVAGLVLGMQLLEPGFTPIDRSVRIGRLPVAAHPDIDAAITRALGGLDVVAVPDRAFSPAIGALGREYGPTAPAALISVATITRALTAAGVGASAKHFPGLGRVQVNTDRAAGGDPATVADDPALRPFAAAARAGAIAIMMSSARYPQLDAAAPAVFSTMVITGLLRGRLGFDGLVVSDDLSTAGALADVPVADRAVRFLQAGGDLALLVDPTTYPAMLSAVRHQAAASAAFHDRLLDAALQVLLSKVRVDLLPCP